LHCLDSKPERLGPYTKTNLFDYYFESIELLP
jgi:hypothetical protein